MRANGIRNSHASRSREGPRYRPLRDDRLPGGGLLRRRRPCYPDRMEPVDLGIALQQELQRGAVAAATLDEVIALLDDAAQPARAAFLEPLFCAMPAQEEQL